MQIILQDQCYGNSSRSVLVNDGLTVDVKSINASIVYALRKNVMQHWSLPEYNCTTVVTLTLLFFSDRRSRLQN